MDDKAKFGHMAKDVASKVNGLAGHEKIDKFESFVDRKSVV